MSSLFGNFKNPSSRGFTLVEMIVVIGIFLIITGVLIADLPGFRGKSSLDLVAQEIATYIRGAQIYSSATLAPSAQSYKYHVLVLNRGSEFKLFSCNYSLCRGGGTDETSRTPLESYSLHQNYEIKNLRGSPGSDLNALKISFERPKMEAIFGDNSIVHLYNYVEIKVGVKNNENGPFRCVRVYKIGQVEVLPC